MTKLHLYGNRKLRDRDSLLIAYPDKEQIGQHAHAAAANLSESHETDLQIAEDISK